MKLNKEDILYLYGLSIERRDKLESTDGLKVLGLPALDNTKELGQVNEILGSLYEIQHDELIDRIKEKTNEKI